MKKITKIPDLVESVKEALFEGILTGELRPGEKLQQEKLAVRLGVSRQPVSHALRLLEEQGILTALDARSLTVAEPDIDSVLQMMDVRKELDGFAAGSAAKKFANNQVTESDHAIVDQITNLVSRNLNTKQASPKRNVLDDIHFHELIRDLSGNPFIQESLARYVLHHNRFIYLMAKDMDHRIWLEHEQIMDAIIAGDQAKSRKLMQDHIARGTLKLKRLSDCENRKPSFDYSGQTAG
jgi:DNA-binding GntR family transcriptional regulator